MQITFPALLGAIFITLKLCGVIAWSWVWVLAPFWIGFAIWLVIVTIAMIIAIIVDKQDRQLKSHIRRLQDF